jgi:hypothetical protein
METKQRQFSIWYVLFLFSVFLLVRSLFFSPHQETVSHSEFKALHRRGKIVDAVMDKQTVTGTFAVGSAALLIGGALLVSVGGWPRVAGDLSLVAGSLGTVAAGLGAFAQRRRKAPL